MNMQNMKIFAVARSQIILQTTRTQNFYKNKIQKNTTKNSSIPYSNISINNTSTICTTGQGQQVRFEL